MNYIETLDAIFSRLIDDIGYIFIDNEQKLKIAQKSGVIRIRNIYFDIKEGQFIRYTTIRSNKHVLMKLKEYDAQGNLICWIPDECGYKVKVYNRYGELIYKHYIKFFDKLNWLRKYIMIKRYPNLALDRKF